MECQTCVNCKNTEPFIYDESYSYPTNAVINLTNQCNFQCPYCFVDFNKKQMSYETAKQCCEFVLANKGKTSLLATPGITFFGGEPLLHKDIIYQIVLEYHGKIEFCITTNGSLLDEDFILFCYKYQVSVMISMDGARKTQERQRPAKNGESSFDMVMKNIHYYIMMNKNAMMRATITKESIPELFDNYLFAKNQGFDSVTFVLNDLTEQYAPQDITIYREQMNRIAIDVADDLLNNRKGIKVVCLNDYYSRAKYANLNPQINLSLKRCGYGTTSCGITTDGDIIPCQEKSSVMQPIILGNVWDGIDQIKHQQVLNEYFQLLQNIACEENCCSFIKAFCRNTLCPSRMENRGFTIPSDVCAFTKINFDIGSRLYQLFNYTPFSQRMGIMENNGGHENVT